MSEIPVATYAPRKLLNVFASASIGSLGLWFLYHVFIAARAFGGHGNPFALTWLVSIALLWWVFLAWFEKPRTVTARQQRQLDEMVVTVAVPTYNEDPAALRLCLVSLFAQTRLPQRIHLVDDGSTVDYTDVKTWFLAEAARLGIEATWVKTVNRGKRHAQMECLADDDADVFLTLDCDSILDARAIEEGLKPMADPSIHSVAGMVAVWNYRANFLARLTGMLYTPFTRGFRSAQSVMGRVMVNSGTLAFYRGSTIRKYAGVYEREQFMGRPMQMNDDSMMTFYALLEGKAVHQPTSVAFTLVPEKFSHYVSQQKRWMRGTLVRTLWWIKYMDLRDPVFWMATSEKVSFVLSQLIWTVLAYDLIRHWGHGGVTVLLYGFGVLIAMNYVIGLRYFIIRRTDEPWYQALLTFSLAPVAGLWRMVILRPMYLYAYCTFWKIGKWGTRETGVEVGVSAAA